MRAPSLPAPGSYSGQSIAGPFSDQLSYEFRQSRKECEDQLSTGRRRVDAGASAGKHSDSDVADVEVLYQVDEIATELMALPYDDHVSLSRRLEKGGEPQAVYCAPPPAGWRQDPGRPDPSLPPLSETCTTAAIDRRTPSDLIEAKGVEIAEALKAMWPLAS